MNFYVGFRVVEPVFGYIISRDSKIIRNSEMVMTFMPGLVASSLFLLFRLFGMLGRHMCITEPENSLFSVLVTLLKPGD